MSIPPKIEIVNGNPSGDDLLRGGPEAEQDSSTSKQVIQSVEAALRDVTDSPKIDATDAPGPSAASIAEERAQQLVTNISFHTLNELRSLREQIDGLMGDMNERRELIREAIRAHAAFAESSIQHKVVISESISKLRGELERSNTPLPPVRQV